MLHLLIKEQAKEIYENQKNMNKLNKEIKLICLQMQMDSLLVIAKLEDDKDKIKEAINKLHEVMSEYNELLNEVCNTLCERKV